ncbi:thiazole biosynthesis family protein [Sinorhizobium meliloti]|nr:thiazole biosynthesis family protein [Sinorhizobium meliloti]
MLTLYGSEINSRLLLGTARYPSPAVLSEAVRQSATEIVTVSLRHQMSGDLNPSNWTDSGSSFPVIFPGWGRNGRR